MNRDWDRLNRSSQPSAEMTLMVWTALTNEQKKSRGTGSGEVCLGYLAEAYGQNCCFLWG